MKREEQNQYIPFTVIQGGLADKELDSELDSLELIYIIASPTGLCGAFTDIELVQSYLATHNNVQVLQMPKNIPLM